MTNFEKHRDELLEFIHTNNTTPALVDGKFINCHSINCSRCEFSFGKCVARFVEWLYEDDGAGCSPDAGKSNGGCKGCHYEGNNILNMPCCHCERAIIDCFEPKKKPEKKQERKTKTRRDEFLEHYPNANVLGIQPCSIDKENSGEYCSKYDWCSECVERYWSQEVE